MNVRESKKSKGSRGEGGTSLKDEMSAGSRRGSSVTLGDCLIRKIISETFTTTEGGGSGGGVGGRRAKGAGRKAEGGGCGLWLGEGEWVGGTRGGGVLQHRIATSDFT